MKNTINILTATAAISAISLTGAISLPKSAQAATLTYNLGGGNASRASFTYTPIDFDAPILTVTGSEADISRNVRRRSDGLGIVGFDGSNGQVDGIGEAFETLLLNFDQRVNILSASFSRLQNNDGFALLVDGEQLVSLNRRLNDNNPFSFASFSVEDTIGSNFGFTVAQTNDDYRLQSITVETVPETTPIMPLLALGLFGLCYSRS